MQKSKKKEHKRIIKYIHSLNKQLLNDDYIGCGRFRIDLDSEYWIKYSDNSGYYIHLIIKLTDTLTGNKALFKCDNYDYKYNICIYANDFLIRCSSGHTGHYPPLHYIAYDIHKIVEYVGNNKWNGKLEDGVINTYNWLERSY